MSDLSTTRRIDYQCGCYYEVSRDISGEVCLINARTCTDCWEQLLENLTDCLVLDSDLQLTLLLPSTVRVTDSEDFT